VTEEPVKGDGFWQKRADEARSVAESLTHPTARRDDVRPRGVDYRTDQVDKEAMAEWHRAYKGLPPVRQMMVATIIWLYRGEPDKTWLARLPSTWHAADAIAALLEAGALRDWGRLVALYPGW